MVDTAWQGGELSREPRELTDGDVVIELTVASSSALPARTSALLPLTDALGASYRALSGTQTVRVETVAMLEELPARRATAWVRVHLEEGSRPLGSPTYSTPALLQRAAHGTLTVLRWMNQSGQPRLRTLRQAMDVLTAGSADELRATPPTSRDLADAVRAWHKAQLALQADDRARVVTRQGSVELDSRANCDDPAGLLVEKRVVNPSTDMIFVVELPDYSGTGEWKLKHGQTEVIASCAAGTLLDRFYRRELDIRPGDAVHCRVEFETAYGPDYEVVFEKFRILDVLEVLTKSLGGHSLAFSQDRPPPERIGGSEPVGEKIREAAD